jgi:hypothetical protein
MALPETYTPNPPGLKPYPRDANGKPLPECGSELFTARIYVDTTPIAVTFALDIKKFTAFVEAGSDDIYIKGNAAGSMAFLAGVAISSQAGGKVRLTTSRPHNIPVGGTVTPVGLTNYTNSYIVTDVPSTTTLQFVAPYVAETPGVTDYLMGGQDLVLSAGDSIGFEIALEALDTLMTVRTATGSGVLTFGCQR